MNDTKTMKSITLLTIIVSTCMTLWTSGFVIHDNVIFQKLGEVSATRATWRVTFVEDLTVFETVSGQVKRDIEKLSGALSEILPKLNTDSQFQLWTSFKKLVPTFEMYRKEFAKTMKGYNEFHLLHLREKRSILPFVGSLASLLFGTVSESELASVKRGLEKTTIKQKKLEHILEESLTISNISRSDISQNRVQLNKVLDAMKTINLKLQNMGNDTLTRVFELSRFVEMYTNTQLSIDTLRYKIQQIASYFEYLQLQLNMLSLGHLSPSVITPVDFRSLLLELRSKIPSNFRLLHNPETNLWPYYQYLPCDTAIYDKQIIIIIRVPLLDMNDPFEIYRIHNLPYPNIHIAPDMLAQYPVETPGLGINRDRTKYVLLSEDDLKKCSTGQPYCTLNEPVFPVSANRHCAVALFNHNRALIKENCKAIVLPNAKLPHPVYLNGRVWAIATKKSINVHVSCANLNPFNLVLKPPLSIIQLNLSCSATSRNFVLPPFYDQRSTFSLTDSLSSNLNFMNFTNLPIWAPLEKRIPYNLTILPERLGSIKDIPMDHLIREIEDLDEVDISNDSSLSWWAYICMSFVGLSVLVLIIKFRTQIKKRLVGVLVVPKKDSTTNESNISNDKDAGHENIELEELPQKTVHGTTFPNFSVPFKHGNP